MKTLDVTSLQEGITATLQEIEQVQSKITDMQKGVRGIIDLEDHLKGKMGESIRSFYEGIHGPFLIFLYQSLTNYSQALENLQQAVYAYEPNEKGFIREEFLDNDVQHGLNKAERVTEGLVDEANGIMDRISDLISLPKLDIEEFDSTVQRSKRKVKYSLEQLYELDHEQTKSLSEVGKDLKLLSQYINEVSRNFASDYAITSFDALSALKITTLPTILKEVYGEPVKEEEDPSLWTKIKDGAVAFGKGVVGTGKGAMLGSFDVGKDTLVGFGNTVMHPVKTGTALGNMVMHPVNTGKQLSHVITESYKRDMINGDAESRSHWVTYALGNAAVSVVGTKGAGTVTKTGVETTKAGVKTAATATSETVKNADLSRFLPYAPQYRLTRGSNVPFNVVNGLNFRDQLISKAKKIQEPDGIGDAGKVGHTIKKTNLGNKIDITPLDNHKTVNKNPGPFGEPNSSVDILDFKGKLKTRRYYDSIGRATRDVDMTNHGNAKMHPEFPHEHIWTYDPNGNPTRN